MSETMGHRISSEVSLVHTRKSPWSPDPTGIDAHSDVAGLLMDRRQHRAGITVKTPPGCITIPTSLMTSRMNIGISTSLGKISPATNAIPVVRIVSQATRLYLSCAMIASRMPSRYDQQSYRGTFRHGFRRKQIVVSHVTPYSCCERELNTRAGSRTFLS